MRKLLNHDSQIHTTLISCTRFQHLCLLYPCISPLPAWQRSSSLIFLYFSCVVYFVNLYKILELYHLMLTKNSLNLVDELKSCFMSCGACNNACKILSKVNLQTLYKFSKLNDCGRPILNVINVH